MLKIKDQMGSREVKIKQTRLGTMGVWRDSLWAARKFSRKLVQIARLTKVRNQEVEEEHQV